MKMRMVMERLSPGVQHRDGADFGAEVAGVGGNATQRLRRRAEQNGVDRRLLWNATSATGAGSVNTTWK